MKKKFLATLLIGLTVFTVFPATKKVSAAGGTLDSSFAFSPSANAAVLANAIQTDGKIIVGGTFTTYSSVSRGHIARLNTDGSLDATFATGVGANNDVTSISLQTDGKIVIGGKFTTYNGTARGYIARLNTDGSLDAGFATSTGASAAVNAIGIQSDGKIIAGGSFTTYNGTVRGRIARLNTDGSLDAGFATSTGASAAVNAIGIQSDGKIIAGGSFTTYNGTARAYITRLSAVGAVDATFTTSLNGTVSSLAIQSSDSYVVVGGAFLKYGVTTKNRILRLTTTGALDTLFTTGSGLSGPASALALQSDGKVIVGGTFATVSGITRAGLVRLNATGTVDTLFNANPGVATAVSVSAIAVQADGKVVFGGNFTKYNNGPRNYLARANTDGSVDTSFRTGSGPDSDAVATAVQADGKIVVGGWFANYDGLPRGGIVRLNTDGTVDTTFTTGTGLSGGGAYTKVTSLVIQTDGKIVIGGQFASYNGVARANIARLNTDGSLDTTFNVGTGAGVGGTDYVDTVALQSDGKVIIGGAFLNYNGFPCSEIARLNTDGSFDTTFTMGTGADNVVEIIAIQPNGKIVIGGTFNSYNGGGGSRLTRLNTDGTRDTTFTTNTTPDYPHALAFQSDGKILLGGNMASYGGLTRKNIARLNADGTVDTSFDSSVGASGMVYSVIVQSDGKIMIGGFFTTYNGTARGFVALLNSNGSLDTTFATGAGADYTIDGMAQQSDGKTIIVGSFALYDGASQPYVARLNPGSASLDLKVSGSDGPLAVTYGATTSITWTGIGVSGCNASGAWSGAKTSGGSEVSGAITSTSTFTLGCDLASDNVIINPGPAPIASVSVATTSIPYGGLAQVQWSSSNIAGCNVNSYSAGATTTISTNVSSTAAGGTPYISNGPLTATTTYSIDCWNSANYHAAIASTTVVVTSSATGGIIATGTPTSCTIASGASSCGGVVSWDIQSATSPEVWLMNAGTTTGTRFSTAASASTSVTYSAGPGSYYWSANADGAVLTANYLVSVSCVSGTAWSATANKCVPLPTITWTANGSPNSSPTFGEGDPQNFGYTSTDADYCSYYNPDTSGTPLFSATSTSWSGLAYWSSWAAKVVCGNSMGITTSTFNVSVLQNSAAEISKSIPVVLLPGQTFDVDVTLQNNGAKPWSADSSPHKLCLTGADLPGNMWGLSGGCALLTGPTTNAGTTRTWTIAITAPSTEGDYGFSVQSREDNLYATSSPGALFGGDGKRWFGATVRASGGNIATSSVASGYIRVKNPTLAISPTFYTFPDSVAGDPATLYPITIWNLGGGLISGGTVSGYTGPFTGPATFSDIGPGTSTSTNILFKPTATGTFSGSLTLSATGASDVIVPLLGTGIDQFTFMDSSNPSAVRIAGSFDFGDAQGIAGVYRRVYIRNNSVNSSAGSSTLDLLVNGTTSPIFLCVENCAFDNIAPGETVWSKWWFHPPLIPVDSSPLSFTGTATWNLTRVSKTLMGVVRGWTVPVKLQFQEK